MEKMNLVIIVFIIHQLIMLLYFGILISIIFIGLAGWFWIWRNKIVETPVNR